MQEDITHDNNGFISRNVRIRPVRKVIVRAIITGIIYFSLRNDKVTCWRRSRQSGEVNVMF